MFQHYYFLIGFFIFNMISTSAHAYFVENKGQVINQFGEVNEEVLFIHQQPGLKVTLTKSGFSYEKYKTPLSKEDIEKRVIDEYSNVMFPIDSYRIDFNFDQLVQHIELTNPIPVYSNYYTSQSEILKVKQYNKIVFKNISTGIDIEFIVKENGKFKYNIIADNYENACLFKLTIGGAESILIDKGELIINTPFDSFKEQIPMSYLVSKKGKEEVNINFLVKENTISFEVPEFNVTKKLIIDPQPEGVWGTYFGGSEYDISTGIATDNDGNVFHCGITMSASNIATTGAHEASYQGGLDGFIAKFNTQGDLLWASYYGGAQTDRPYGLSTDENGNVYLGGASYSELGIATIGSYQDVLEGLDDIFIVKFNPDGIREWGTYIGGPGHDFVTTLKHNNGIVYITGHTKSTSGIATPGTFLASNGANEAAYLIALSDDGNTVHWGTYIGANNSSSGEGIEVIDNTVVIGGRTTSTTGISSLGAHQTALNGFGNGFIQRFDNTGNLIWGTYYGGNYTDKILGIVVDYEGNIFCAGDASSEFGIATSGAYQETRLSSEQGFLAKFNSNGNRLWGTYLGGTSSDYITSVAINDSTLIVGGKTLSSNWISSPGAFQESIAGGYDGFLNGFNTNGQYLWGSYYGGEQDENIAAIATDNLGNIYGAGAVTGSLQGIHFGNAHQSNFGGASNDGFIFKFCFPSYVTVHYESGLLIASGAENYEWFLDGETLGLFSDTIQPSADGVYTVIGSSSGSCESISNEYIHNTINLNFFSNDTYIFPNPNKSNGWLFVKSETYVNSVLLMSMNGQEIMHKSIMNNTFQFQLPELENGLYIVRFLTKNSFVDKKLLINE